MYSNINYNNLLNILTFDESFIIDEIKMDEKCFGNVLLLLHSDDFKIKFVSEKNNFWCEIGKNDLYFIEDVFSLLNIKSQFTNVIFEEYISNIAIVIREKYQELVDLFLPENFSDSEKKLKEIGVLRAKKMFGIT